MLEKGFKRMITKGSILSNKQLNEARKIMNTKLR
jgi:hypothetical protein